MVAKMGQGTGPGRGGAPSGASSAGGGETASVGHTMRGIPSGARLAILAALGLGAHSQAAVAQNAASLQIAAVVMELPLARTLPAHLEREAKRAGQQTLDSGSGGGARREELRGGLAAVVTEKAGRQRLRV
jgi:hypothetical protein